MSAHITAVRGEAHYNAKLTDDDVRLIRALVEERSRLIREMTGLTNRSIAQKFGVSERCIERVASGAGWTHVRGNAR